MKRDAKPSPATSPSSSAATAKPDPLLTVKLLAGVGSLVLDACAKDPELARTGARFLRSLAGLPEPAPEPKK